MANFVASTTTLTTTDAWEEGDRNGKTKRVRKRLTLVLSSQGGLTNLIPVSELGFQAGNVHLAQTVLFTDGSSNKRWIGLFTDGTYLYTADPSVATDADRGKAADVTGTLVCEVAGPIS